MAIVRPGTGADVLDLAQELTFAATFFVLAKRKRP
jgi:hypothetical protein